MIRFLCGCKFKGDPSDPVQYATDDEGFIVCQEHRQRRYGWRSVPYTATTMMEQGMGGWSELDYERYVVFGVIPQVA